MIWQGHDTYPGETVDTNEDVRTGNNSLSGGALDLPSQVLVAVDRVDRVTVGGHDTGDSEVKTQAEDRPGKEDEPATNAVDEGEDETGRDEEDNVLDSGGVESRVTTLIC